MNLKNSGQFMKYKVATCCRHRTKICSMTTHFNCPNFGILDGEAKLQQSNIMSQIDEHYRTSNWTTRASTVGKKKKKRSNWIYCLKTKEHECWYFTLIVKRFTKRDVKLDPWSMEAVMQQFTFLYSWQWNAISGTVIQTEITTLILTLWPSVEFPLSRVLL